MQPFRRVKQIAGHVLCRGRHDLHQPAGAGGRNCFGIEIGFQAGHGIHQSRIDTETSCRPQRWHRDAQSVLPVSIPRLLQIGHLCGTIGEPRGCGYHHQRLSKHRILPRLRPKGAHFRFGPAGLTDLHQCERAPPMRRGSDGIDVSLTEQSTTQQTAGVHPQYPARQQAMQGQTLPGGHLQPFHRSRQIMHRSAGARRPERRGRVQPCGRLRRRCSAFKQGTCELRTDAAATRARPPI